MLAKVKSVTATSSDELLRLDSVAYHAGATHILDGIDLVFRNGAPTVLMGPNGSGKTTLLKLAARLVEPTAGSIQTAHALRLAVVFQRPVMLRRTVGANIAFARTAAGFSASADVVTGLLARVGLADLVERPARRLSGGEQQRVAIARALAREPDVLCLDEPTASLDPASTKAIEDVIAAVAASGVKVVIATHDMGQARRLAGDVVFLVRGRIAEHTSGATFFNTPATDSARRFLAGELVL
jgi:tungstate transport system ATP-binding protein